MNPLAWLRSVGGIPLAPSSGMKAPAIPRMFAALLLLSLTGIVIFLALSALSHLALRRWHESARAREQ